MAQGNAIKMMAWAGSVFARGYITVRAKAPFAFISIILRLSQFVQREWSTAELVCGSLYDVHNIVTHTAHLVYPSAACFNWSTAGQIMMKFCTDAKNTLNFAFYFYLLSFQLKLVRCLKSVQP